MSSIADITSKLAYITGKLTAGGTNAEMKEWYDEHKKLNEELVAAKALDKAPPQSKEDVCGRIAPENTPQNLIQQSSLTY